MRPGPYGAGINSKRASTLSLISLSAVVSKPGVADFEELDFDDDFDEEEYSYDEMDGEDEDDLGLYDGNDEE